MNTPAADPPSRMIGLSLATDMVRALDDAAAREHLTRSAYARRAILMRLQADAAASLDKRSAAK